MFEFGLIEQIFKPLVTEAGALGLTDDAAVLTPRQGEDIVLTKDVMVEGVHFLEGTAPGLIAQKLLRVNLSDLAAMGAEPMGYLLGNTFGPAHDETWIRAYAKGLKADQDTFGISLLGGDMTKSKDTAVFSLTALGWVPDGMAIKRSGAQPGDDVWVSGTVGDACLGLAVREGRYSPVAADAAYLISRFDLPTPRLGVGMALRGVSHSAIDISDGLVADLFHIAEVSTVSITIEADRVPVSDPARRALGAGAATLPDLLTFGDDYELGFTAPEDQREALAGVARDLELPLTRIGSACEGSAAVTVLDNGQPLPLERKGYTHF